MPGKPKLGEILINAGLITQEQLEEALKEQSQKGGYLGQILINKGFVTSGDINKILQQASPKIKQWDGLAKMLMIENIITQEQLDKAVTKSNITKQSLDKVLIELGYISEAALASALARFLDIPYVKLSDLQIDPKVVHLLPTSLVRRHRLIPVRLEGNTLFLAMSDPFDLDALEEVRLVSKYKIKEMVAAEKEIIQAIEQYFNIQQMAKQMLSELPSVESELEKEILVSTKAEIGTEEPPVSRFLDSIIHEGIVSRASDIHFEPQFPQMRLRYRIDGTLHDIMNIPKRIESAIISRIKILADMDITEHRRPQDGHISLRFNNKEYDLRVASFATITGEKIVIRILDKSGMLINLSALGFSLEDPEKFNTLLSRNYGIILVTGPTGSGKTTTLYAALNQMDRLTKNIITIEDPVEYKLEGINQAQVNPIAGITFATGLRSILRQDPNIIMVGEIRDLDTAEIAIHAALTGHLVFSTLHTNDASSAITRLIDMGIEPFLVASSLIGVLAQRLIKTICPECKEEYKPDNAVLEELTLKSSDKEYVFKRGRGCAYCFNTGYRGRTAVFEIMNISENIRELISTRQSSSKIKEIATQEGMHTLRQSAIQKVIDGISTPEEIKRVISIQEG
jgi:type IV pilus assembly protein PilB